MKKEQTVTSQTAGRLLGPLGLAFPPLSLQPSGLSFPTKNPTRNTACYHGDIPLQEGLEGGCRCSGAGGGGRVSSQLPSLPGLCSWRYPRAPRNPEPSLKSTEVRQPRHFRLEETDVQRG